LTIYKKYSIIILDKRGGNMKIKEQNVIHIQIDGKLKQELYAEAESKGLSLNAYIRMILIERGK
jgi:predicted HicB family RNase H-like nuclease